MGRIYHGAAALALAAMGAAVPLQAQARCWTPREASAAQLRQMQTMLMVAALRCRAARLDITADYDDFVASQRGALTNANIAIKQHFADEGGSQADYDRFATSLANGFGDDQTSEGSCAEAAMLAHDASMMPPAALEPLAAARLFPVALPGGVCGAGPWPMRMAAAPIAPPPAQPVALAMAAPMPAPVMRTPPGLPMVHPDPAPIVPIDAMADEEAKPIAPPIVALAPPPPPPPPPPPMVEPASRAGPSLPPDVLAAMAVLARYQASLAPAELATAQR